MKEDLILKVITLFGKVSLYQIINISLILYLMNYLKIDNTALYLFCIITIVINLVRAIKSAIEVINLEKGEK